jgi:Fructose-2,6-bisphosphatase
VRKIGFVRHYEVMHKPVGKWMTAAQFNDWVEQYDKAELRTLKPDVGGIEWEVCFSSHLSRATRTADSIFKGKIILSEQLREIGIHAVSARTRIKLPLSLWLILARLAWYVSHRSQEEGKVQTISRARRFIESIERDYGASNVLIVSHGAFIKVLAKELRLRGYKGKTGIIPKNGRLYAFMKRQTKNDRSE